MAATDEQMRVQMLQWGEQRDEAIRENQDLKRRCGVLAAENESLRAALDRIHRQAGDAVNGTSRKEGGT